MLSRRSVGCLGCHGRVLRVAARGPSARAASDVVMTDQIRAIHCDSDATYGSRRVHAQLLRDGVAVNVKRVARLMRVSQIVGAHVPAKHRRNRCRRGPGG